MRAVGRDLGLSESPLNPARPTCSLFAITLGLGACSESTTRPTDAVHIAVEPLSLPSIGKVCYDVEVTNGPARTGDVVWSLGTPGLNGGDPDPDALCSDRYGNGAGGALTYIGSCDADGQLDADADGERMNSVTIWFDGLYSTGGAYLDPDGSAGWQNPCARGGVEVGCTLDVLCEENADAPVVFDFTVLRDADQGFFDVAVTFEDMFCSAKVDCLPALLHHGGVRDATAVVGFACTSGEAERTVLQLSDLVLACDGLEPVHLPAAAPPGNQGAAGAGVYAWAVYQGDESLTSNGAPLAKCFWNRAVGIDRTALAGKRCTLSGVGTASHDGVVPPAGSSAYPIVRFEVEVLGADGSLCGPNPLNGDGSGVRTDYLLGAAAPTGDEAHAATFTCGACSSDDDATCDGVDDDCDGATDEDYVAVSSACGEGVCASTGLVTCVDGQLVDSCVAGSPQSWIETFDDSADAADVHVAAYRAGVHCDDLSATTQQGLECAPAPGWSATGGADGAGYVFGLARDNNLRHYGLTIDTVPRPNLLGGHIEGTFRTIAADHSGSGAVKAAEGSSNLPANATTATARARWILTARNPTTQALWIWVSRDSFAWNPNGDSGWVTHGIDVTWENFAQWQPFVSASYPGGTAQDFASSVNNVLRVGVIMSDASINYAKHLDSSWYRTQRYGVMSTGGDAAPVELGWDQLTLTATGTDCNNNGLDDDCNGFIDDCAPR